MKLELIKKDGKFLKQIMNITIHINLQIKDKKRSYYLNHIIGIEQVTDDEFFVYRRANSDDFEIGRYKLQNSTINQLFAKRFDQFYFISNDRIMFTNWGNTGPYRCGGIYSIKDNKILEEAKWLDGSAIDIYIDDENSDKIILYVEQELSSYKLHNPKLLLIQTHYNQILIVIVNLKIVL